MNKKSVKKTEKMSRGSQKSVNADTFAEFWEESWTYIKTVVDVLREPVLILDKNLKVLVANEAFYSLFQVKPAETEDKIVYELGNGQWDIPGLRKLLDDILSKDTYFKGFEVEHEFPSIGARTIILNARQIYSKHEVIAEWCTPIIMLAMEDVTGIMTIANTLANHTNHLEEAMSERTKAVENKIASLEKQIRALTKSKK